MITEISNINYKIQLLNSKRRKNKLPLILFYPRMSEKQIFKFEEKHKIEIPQEYRLFLLNVGNGQKGSSPEYAYLHLNSLDQTLHYKISWAKINPNFLTTPFPFNNIMTTRIINSIVYEGNYFPYSLPEILDSCIDRIVPGYLCLSRTSTLDVFYGLIITGEQRGKIWMVDQANFPLFTLNESSIIQHNFLSWYNEWLDEQIMIP